MPGIVWAKADQVDVRDSSSFDRLRMTGLLRKVGADGKAATHERSAYTMGRSFHTPAEREPASELGGRAPIMVTGKSCSPRRFETETRDLEPSITERESHWTERADNRYNNGPIPSVLGGTTIALMA